MKKYLVEVYDNGDVYWYNEAGAFHREEGPAIEFTDGYSAYYINGKYHRENAPARIFPKGNTEYHLNGKLHREDGPAMDFNDIRNKWFLQDFELTQEEFLSVTKTKLKLSDIKAWDIAKILGYSIDDREFGHPSWTPWKLNKNWHFEWP